MAPNPRDDLVPGDNLVPVLKEQDKHLQGDALQLQDMIAAAQPPGTKVKLIIFAEPDRLRALGLGWKPRHPHWWVGGFYNTSETTDVSAKSGCT